MSEFLDRQKALLEISQLVGFLERWIRWKIKISSPQQLLSVERELMEKSREVQGGRASLGAVHKAWISHPLHNLLSEERIRREFLLENNSDDYLGLLGSGLSTTDIQDFLIWKGEKHGSLEEWKKDKRRSLRVINIKETEAPEENNRRLSSSREGILPLRPDRPSDLKGSESKGKEDRAYGVRREKTS